MQNLSNGKKKKVLVIDDEPFMIAVITDALKEIGYEVVSARSGKEGIRIARETMPDVILLDVVMPEMDGFQTCRELKVTEGVKHIPVVMITALKDKESRYKGLEVGAIDFQTKPPDIMELMIRLKNVTQLKEYQDFLKSYNDRLEKEVEEKTIALRQSFIDTIYRLTVASEYKDKGTASHLKRVSHYTLFLSSFLGYSNKEAKIMFFASPMHDVGKIGIPDNILNKHGGLTEAEFEIMKTHTTIGGEILSGSDSDYLISGERFARYHHEHWDGSGYPNKVSGEDIPIEGRIMIIVDRYDAMRSARPYKEPIDHETTLKYLLSGLGTRTTPGHFDPVIFEAFRDNHKKFDEIYEEFKD